jgi:voltage-gated sodium channel
MNYLRKLFLNEKAILAVIILNSVLLFIQECGITSPLINTLDVACTIIFVIEMIVKLVEYGFKGYWKSGWNKLDGTLVLLSIPSLIFYFIPDVSFDVSFLLILRVLRVFRFFRLIHAFPGFTSMIAKFANAMHQSYAVFVGLLVMIIVFAMIGSTLFKEAAPEYFATPLDGIYSTFRIFTGEGWNEIPDTVAANSSEGWGYAIRLYFSLVLIVGCIIGMSLLNSIFVDAMVADNNDGVEDKLDQIEEKLVEIQEKLNKINERTENI